LAVVTEAVIWALLYLLNSSITVLPDLATALYFSMATFTTVGYGDIVLAGEWRILASLQAANGMIMFGWSTALIFHYIQRAYGPE
jgi:voltage-gated potassium channel Kch